MLSTEAASSQRACRSTRYFEALRNTVYVIISTCLLSVPAALGYVHGEQANLVN